MKFTATPIIWLEVRGPAEAVRACYNWCTGESLFGIGPAGPTGYYGPAFGTTPATRHKADPATMVFRRAFHPDDAERVIAWLRENGGTAG